MQSNQAKSTVSGRSRPRPGRMQPQARNSTYTSNVEDAHYVCNLDWSISCSACCLTFVDLLRRFRVIAFVFPFLWLRPYRIVQVQFCTYTGCATLKIMPSAKLNLLITILGQTIKAASSEGKQSICPWPVPVVHSEAACFESIILVIWILSSSRDGFSFCAFV